MTRLTESSENSRSEYFSRTTSFPLLYKAAAGGGSSLFVLVIIVVIVCVCISKHRRRKRKEKSHPKGKVKKRHLNQGEEGIQEGWYATADNPDMPWDSVYREEGGGGRDYYQDYQEYQDYGYTYDNNYADPNSQEVNEDQDQSYCFTQ